MTRWFVLARVHSYFGGTIVFPQVRTFESGLVTLFYTINHEGNPGYASPPQSLPW